MQLINILKRIYNPLLTKQFKISLIAMVYLLICYTLLRLGFFLVNHGFFSDIGTGEIIRAFLYGIRFDISALLMINGPLLLLYNLPLKLINRKYFKLILLVLFLLLNLIFITVNLADYGYFPVTQRRLMSEIYIMFVDIMRMLPSMFSDYYYLFLALAVGGMIFIFTVWRLFKKLDNLIIYQPNLWRDIGCLILLIGLITIGVKGGIQRKPIRQAHAFWSANRITGYLTLNSSFTTIKSLFQAGLPRHSFLPDNEASAELTAMLCQKNEQMIDAQYPFLRRKSFPDAPQKPNLVVFIMESWTADYIGSLSGQTPSATPFFDSLTISGTLFTNFLANGHRSVVAIPSILDSIPGFYSNSLSGVAAAKSRLFRGKGNSFIESQSEVNNYIGLGNILLKQGYTTSCHHGARRGALGFDIHSKLSGFLNYYGMEDYLKSGGSSRDTVWGVWDEEFFQDALCRMDKFQSPFCSVIFSLTSHEPFRIPPHRQKLFEQYADETNLQIALRYSDYSLQQFFQIARKKPWFENTIFIITADHTTHSKMNNFYSCFHIPLLIYAPRCSDTGRPDRSVGAPGLIAPQICNTIGSQVDILPTILDLLHISATHNSMGSSLMDTERTHYTVVTDGSMYGIFNNQFVLLNDLEKNFGLYNYHLDPILKNDIQIEYPDAAQKLRHSLLAYIQSVSNAIAQNKICPPR
ncbi:MAG: LTA synthase family protein [Planctomycetota bacterium]